MDFFALIQLFFVHFFYDKIWVQTSQSDFIDDYSSYVDIYSSPGDILVMNYPEIHQSQLRANSFLPVYSTNWVSHAFFLRNPGYIEKIRLYSERYGLISSLFILKIRNCLHRKYFYEIKAGDFKDKKRWFYKMKKFALDKKTKIDNFII